MEGIKGHINLPNGLVQIISKFYKDSVFALIDTFNMIESVAKDIPQASASKAEIEVDESVTFSVTGNDGSNLTQQSKIYINGIEQIKL